MGRQPAWANNTLDGNLENIKIAGEYFLEVWKAAGVDMSKIEIVSSNSWPYKL